jgi:2-phospho-L-lactate guanylyltransferase
VNVFAIVPVKGFERAKTRMSALLSPEERAHLSSLMLDNTLQVLCGARSLQRVLVVSNEHRAGEIASRHGAEFLHEASENGVNAAVSMADEYCVRNGADASIVIPQDLPLLDPAGVEVMCRLAEGEERCIVLCPSQRYDGTNALLRKPSTVISTFFDNDSYENHIGAARECGVPVRLYFSKSLMCDIDTPEDASQLAKEEPANVNGVLEFLKAKQIAREKTHQQS